MDPIDIASMRCLEALPRSAPYALAPQPCCRRWRLLALALLWGCLATACNSTRLFLPQTPDQQAIARTIETFHMALHQQNATALRATLTTDATITTVLEGTRLSTKPYREIEQQYFRESLLAHEANIPLLNFQQTTPDSATVETFLVVSPTIETTQKKAVLWNVQRQQDGWRISAITEKSATEDVHLRIYGGGP